jgi:Ca-activated chloride channel family protein
MNKVLLAIVVFASLAGATGRAQDPGVVTAPAAVPRTVPLPTMRITSPLGRTSTPATLRIVVQITWPADAEGRTHPQPLVVRFSVDGTSVGSVEAGPPYAVNWVDENPFEPHEITVEASLPAGEVVRDAIKLPAFEFVETAEVASILVDAAIYDAAGRIVGNLDTKSVVLLENGEPQPIDLFAPEKAPSTMILLVDNSESMSLRMDGVRRAAELFARSLGEGDRIIVVPFNHNIGTITGPTGDVPTIVEAIGAMKAGGGTAILDAVQQGARLLQGTEGRRGIILITDGFDENSTVDLNTAIESAQKQQATVYAVAVGGVNGVSVQGERTFRAITDRTGGRAFFPWVDAELAAVARDTIKDQQTRYLITYTPTNQRKDGSWRAISFQLPPGHKARAREGYRAPLPAPIRNTMEFTVTDRSRGFVSIAADDLEVVEDGVVQKVETFQEAVDPVGIALLLDASGSMTRSADTVRAAAREFVAAVRPEDSLALITFADEPLFGHLLGTNRELSLTAIHKYATGGGTALYDGLWNGLLHLKTAQGRKAIVVLTDGRDENRTSTGPASTHTLGDVQNLARQVGAALFPIGLGSRVDRDLLEQLANASGGEAYVADDAAKLAEPFRDIIENLRQRYILSYTSTNTRHDGAWRRVQIRPRDPSLAVKAAAGYYAPGP